MDPLTILSVAANIVQFIDFSSKLLSTGHKMYKSASGSLVENLELEAIAESVQQLSGKVSESISTMTEVRNIVRLNRRGFEASNFLATREEQEHQRLIDSMNENNASIRRVCEACGDVAAELIQALNQLKVHSNNRRWESFRTALTSIRHPEIVQQLSHRLSELRAQLDSNILFALRIKIDAAAIKNTQVLEGVGDIRADTEAIKLELLGHIQQSQEWQTSIISAIYQGRWQSQDRQHVESFSTKLSDMAKVPWESHMELKLINRLRFPGMSERESRIASAHNKTFQWIYCNPEERAKPWGNFVQWLESDESLYWITGKAGSGKSTLMKFLSSNPRTWQHLRVWAKNMRLFTAGFFFWNSGREMQMSSMGFLQALLYSCLRQQPSLARHVFPERWQAYQLFGEDLHPWSWMELISAFKAFVSQAGEASKIIFFVDGMDEFNGKHPELIELILEIAAHPNVKICLASRPWIVFEDAFGALPSLTLQDLTYPDIKLYVESQLYSNRRFSQLQQREPGYTAQLVRDISEKSAGVFLWISLVVRSLLEGLANSDRLSDLSRRLTLMPDDLDGLYTSILESLDQFYMEHASQIIQIVHQASSPLSLLELSFADEEDPQTATMVEIKPSSQEEKQFRCEGMKRRLNSRCKGLLEVPALRSQAEDSFLLNPDGSSSVFTGFNQHMNLKPSSHSEATDSQLSRPLSEHLQYSPDDLGNLKVEYLHRTVKDFLEKPRVWKMILSASNPSFNPSSSLATGFLMRLKDHSEDKLVGDDNMWRSVQCCWDYATQAEISHKYSQTLVLKELERVASYLGAGPSGSDAMIPSHAKIELITKRSAFLDHRAQEKLLKPTGINSGEPRQYMTFQMQAELYKSVQTQLQAGVLIAQNTNGQPLLSLAILGFEIFAVLRRRLIKLLLECKADPNQEYCNTTPWKDLISQVIIDSKVKDHPYHDVVMESWADLVAMFIEHGATVEVDDNGSVVCIREAFGSWNPGKARELVNEVNKLRLQPNDTRRRARLAKYFSKRK